MKNSFKNKIQLSQISLPLQALNWEHRDLTDVIDNRHYIYNNIHNTSKYEPFTFYKPINQIF